MALLKGHTTSSQAAPREPAIFAKKNKNRNKPTRFYLKKKVGPADFFNFFQRTLMKRNFRICQDIDNKHDPKPDVHD